MILGSYREPQGAFITGFVYFQAVNHVIPVRFLVDTGAAQSFISMADLTRLRREVRVRISTSQGAGIRGVGGTTQSVITPASIILRHEDSDATSINLQISLLPNLSSLDLPSVLGRDVLFRGPLRFEPADGAVYFDAPKTSLVI